MNKRSILITLAVLVLIAVTLACGESTPEVRTPGFATERPAPTPTTAPLGSSRSNPAPAGSEVIISDITIKVGEVTRPADDIVAAGNMFNSAPEPGNEYIMVTVSVVCNKSSDATCQLSCLDFKLTGSSGSIHDAETMMDGVAGLLPDLNHREFFGGSTTTGGMIFEVVQGETDLVLIYKPWLDILDVSEVYLAVE